MIIRWLDGNKGRYPIFMEPYPFLRPWSECMGLQHQSPTHPLYRACYWCQTRRTADHVRRRSLHCGSRHLSCRPLPATFCSARILMGECQPSKSERQNQGKDGGIVRLAYMISLVSEVGKPASSRLATSLPKREQPLMEIGVRHLNYPPLH